MLRNWAAWGKGGWEQLGQKGDGWVSQKMGGSHPNAYASFKAAMKDHSSSDWKHRFSWSQAWKFWRHFKERLLEKKSFGNDSKRDCQIRMDVPTQIPWLKLDVWLTVIFVVPVVLKYSWANSGESSWCAEYPIDTMVYIDVCIYASLHVTNVGWYNNQVDVTGAIC